MSAARLVMIVDDDDALRESMSDLLEDEGFRVIPASDGESALARLREGAEKPDVILLDLMMPRMNGWQFRAEQLGDPSIAKIPLVVMTASRDVRGIQADEIVYKPLKLAELVSVVRRHTDARQHADAPKPPPSTSLEASPNTEDAMSIFTGGGEMGGRMRALDWSETPLGAPKAWPQSLRSAVSICLGSRFPIAVYWGAPLTLLYNDMWRPIAGGKHPWALGRGAREVWPEIWDSIGPLFERVMTTGEGTYSEDALLPMRRHGYTEECYFNFTFSPIRGVSGHVEGVFNAVVETTYRVVSERRSRVLRDLGERIGPARSAADVCRLSASSLGAAMYDVPFCVVYLVEGVIARRVACVGLPPDGSGAPETLALDDGAAVWQLGSQVPARIEYVADLGDRLGFAPRGGAWPEPAHAALVAPLVVAGAVVGHLVLGANPRRAVDDEYLQFVERAALQISNALAGAGAYEAERQRAEGLAAVDRAKSAFFSNVSHEFRTPLTLMLGPTEDLLAGVHGPVSGPQREQLSLLQRNAHRLQKLVNSLLDHARLEGGRMQASYEPVDLAALTRELAGAFRAAIERAGLTFTIDCPELDSLVEVDRDMWEKIVLNLVSNAFKFTFEGGIDVSLRSEGDVVVLRVKDTGVGIPESEVPHLFERFHRVEGARSRTHEGSGIGLALVMQLVKLQGGTVRTESRLGVGSTFTVALPKRTGQASERPGAASLREASLGGFVEEALRWSVVTPGAERQPVDTSAAASRTEPEAAREIVLVAEDNADMRDYLARLLRERWDVEAVADGHAALEAMRRRPPDLVVTDVMMPGLDGFALLRQLREDETTRFIPVIMLSARAADEARSEGLEAGADDYLVKPFAARELVARVRTHLELARLRADMRKRHEELFALFMQAPSPISVLRGPDLRFELANDHYLESTNRHDILGKRFVDVFPELATSRFVDELQGAMRTGRAFSADEVPARFERGRGPDDESYWSYTFKPLRNADGVHDRVMVIASDVTHGVIARRAIERSEEKFRAILMQVRAGIAQIDMSGRFVLTNERFREILGRSEREIRQLGMEDLVHADDLSTVMNKLSLTLETGSPFLLESRWMRPDASIVWVQANVSRFDDRDGRAVGATAVIIDITQRRFAEQNERALREEAERAARFAEVFVGILSHDLRNPLNAITMAATVIETRATSEAISKPIARITRSADRMERMIAQLLDFTRIRLGDGLPLERAQTDLSEIARTTIEELQPVHQREIRLHVEGAVVGTWDKDRLSQLLSNLVANACQHGRTGTPVTVKIDGRRSERVELEIANLGAIPVELLPTIFEPMHQTERTTRSAGSSGLGLGLYITRQIVLAHGGTIRVDSNEPDGTEFVVELPRDQVEKTEHVFGDEARSGR